MSRPYTGYDKPALERRPGLEHLVGAIVWNTAGRLTNLGTLGHRPQRGSRRPSVHGTGRAADIGWAAYKTWPGSNRANLVRLMDYLVDNADELGLELLIDYGTAGRYGGGRAWKCDRHEWADLKPGVVAGGGLPSSRWCHLELSNETADNVERIAAVINGWHLEAEPAPAPVKKAPAKKAAAKRKP